MVNIYYLQKTTLQDYPAHIACIVFLSGCNFRCSFCHNPAAVYNKDSQINEDEFLNFLDSRKGKLDGVVVTGGEPTIYGDKLIEFLQKIKARGFDVKLDTNGSNPVLLKKIFARRLVDYVAMDVKCPLNKYKKVSGCALTNKTLQNRIKKSIGLIMESGFDYEFRTTAYPELNVEDFKTMFNLVKGCKRYIIQKYVPDVTLDFQKPLVVYGDETLKKIGKMIDEFNGTIQIR